MVVLILEYFAKNLSFSRGCWYDVGIKNERGNVMALIRCPECGREISDKARACPGCGCPVEKMNFGDHGEDLPETGRKNDYWERYRGTENPNMYKCVKCGRMIPVGNAKCKYCGFIQSKEYYEYATQNTGNCKGTSSHTSHSDKYEWDDVKLMVTVIRWIAAAACLVFGLMVFSTYEANGILSFVSFLLCGFFISPLTKYLPVTFPKWLRIVIPIVLFFIAIGFIPAPNGSDDVAVVAEVETGENESADVESLSAESEAETQNSGNAKSEIENNTEIAISEDVEYEDVFTRDLGDNWSDYVGKYIRTTFETSRCDGDYIESTYEDGYIKVYPDNYRDFEYGDYITVTGKVSGKEGVYVELEESHIEEYGDSSKAYYDAGMQEYNARKEQERADEEIAFKEKAESPSYDDLLRYPDTYKDKQIKITVKITDVEPDGIIFSGHYEATMSGTNNKIALYDEREVKEPKLQKGDTVVIYGYGDGETTIKVQDTSGIIPKTVDKYTIPGVNIKYVEIK